MFLLRVEKILNFALLHLMSRPRGLHLPPHFVCRANSYTLAQPKIHSTFDIFVFLNKLCAFDVFIKANSSSESNDWLYSEEYENFRKTFLDKMEKAKLNLFKTAHHIRLNVNEGNKILFCPKYIANLQNGNMDKVAEATLRILYK